MTGGYCTTAQTETPANGGHQTFKKPSSTNSDAHELRHLTAIRTRRHGARSSPRLSNYDPAVDGIDAK
jgi:hypothetical protein